MLELSFVGLSGPFASRLWLDLHYKGTVQRDIRPSVFSSFETAWYNGLKYFWFGLRFRRVNRFFRKNLPGVIIPVLRSGVSYSAESISPGYHTGLRQSPRGIILRRVNIPGVSYILRRVNIPGVSYVLCRVNLPGVSNPGVVSHVTMESTPNS